MSFIRCQPCGFFRPIFVQSGGDFIISFPTVTGKTYLLQRSDTLAAGSWTDAGADFPAAAGPATETSSGPQDFSAFGNPDKLFVRVRLKP